jgi:hypothetical protein
MRLRQSTIISGNALTVWPFLADPALQAEWNPKVLAVRRDRFGPVELGEQFEMLYRMSARDNYTRVEVVASVPSEHVCFVHRTMWKSIEQVVEEAYTVSPRRKGVKVVQTIDLSRAGIPWPLLLLIWSISRFGQPTEEPYLNRLKRLIERPGG